MLPSPSKVMAAGLLTLCAAIAVAPQLLAQTPTAAPAADLEENVLSQLQGEWRVVSSQVGDEKAAADEIARRHVTIVGNKLIYRYGTGQNPNMEGTFKLSPQAKHLDWEPSIAGESAGPMLAIYELKGDELKIGFALLGRLKPP